MSINNPARSVIAPWPAASMILLTLICFVLLNSTTLWAAELTIEERLQRVEDEREINALIILYGQYLDSKNFEAYAGLFAREGTWSGGTTNFVPVKGPDAIRATMEKAFADRVYDPEHITNVHLITNIKIEVSDDQATGYSKYTVMTRNEKNEPYVRVNGAYEDVFIREDGRWKFLSRVARRSIP